ncbi:hypothetical protein A2W13_02460 [Candidatus Woesebacteria bacterium RBG_16_36_11]|uniref:Glycosyl transferase family 1 domain-containing protein n=3 Tax=Candidatus Woeseibacteriota TaxID=1752722 RepID=A0A1F7X9L0_9BACT|nr:MAG: hypothetical protein A2Z67_01115 [Candidatus Woesebacteria bacterium RBG_13_36_22]OGM11704.1 MAG: hypothetical protein A2W13_02460 [Candidatus Woesebacteria bacterium RBG_16_36_11]
MKIALVYDRVNKWGGAERVLLVLHELFPDAPLFTSLYDENKAQWAKVFPAVIPSFLQKLPKVKSHHEFLAIFMPFAFESINFRKFDLVISVSSEAAKGIITTPGTVHICYCLTPTRYLWSHYKDYFKGRLIKAISEIPVNYLKRWDRAVAQRPDIIVAISTEVKNRIKKYYHRDSRIIFPPVEISTFYSPESLLPYGNRKYFLIVSRLVPYKKVDMAIKAFNKLGYPLMIVGTGSEEKKLKKLAKRNIVFKSLVSEEELPSLYRKAKCFIMPQEEDFGITCVEAQASGVPVIAYKKGGALDTVVEGKTGLFFTNPTADSIVDAVKRFDRMRFKTENIIGNAKRFSKEEFTKNILSLINKL